MSTLEGKVIFISGASSGIGAELARQFVHRGAQVGLLARREDRLQDLSAELGGSDTAVWARADVSDATEFAAGLDELQTELGAVDIIIANAGYSHPEPVDEFEPGAAQRMYDTNLFGMLRMIDWALPGFIERGDGHIVGISSLASYLGMPHSASYSGSKAAMRIHLQGLRIALRPKGVAVTTICPGFVETPMTEDATFPTPFMMSDEKAATRIVRAIEQRKGEVSFPLPTRMAISFARRVLPTPFAEAILRFGP